MEAHNRSEKLSASPPLFESELLNFFSRVHPAVPAVVFVPVVVAMGWLGGDCGYGALPLFQFTLARSAIWPVAGYSPHRPAFPWVAAHPLRRPQPLIIPRIPPGPP